jgi:hypothetical protein
VPYRLALLGAIFSPLVVLADPPSPSSNSASPPMVAAAPPVETPITHFGVNDDGWCVAETAGFRIYHTQDKASAERIARVAEGTRRDVARKWFAKDMLAWQSKCVLIVYATGDDYRRMTGTRPFEAPGHAHIDHDKNDASRGVSRSLHLRFDVPAMTEAVLPHETAHVVLAGQFGRFAVPRWADEGMAVLSEPAAKIQQHHGNLLRCRQEGLLFGLQELMVLKNYPEQRRVRAFYAQSVALVDLLSRQKGPLVFTRFVRDGLGDGYDTALERHYGMNFAQLQQLWDRQFIGE